MPIMDPKNPQDDTMRHSEYANWHAALERARVVKGEICERAWSLVQSLAKAKLHQTPDVARFSQTDDLRSAMCMRLLDLINEGWCPESDADLKNFASQIVDGKRIDLWRKFRGPNGLRTNTDSVAGQSQGNSSNPGALAAAPSREQSVTANVRLKEYEDWGKQLPDELDRKIFEMKSQRMTDAEVASNCECSEKTVARHWVEIRRLFGEHFGGETSTCR